MKTRIATLLLCIAMLIPAHHAAAQIPIIDIIKAAVKKVIRAVDLQIQRQQNKVIWLQNAQKTLENTMSKLKLNEISEWSEKSRKLYDDYFQELWKVKNAISSFNRVKEIVRQQLHLVEEYKHAWGLLKQDKNFSPKELDEMYQVYSRILDESIKNIDQVFLVTNSSVTQMTDGKRMELIQNVSKNLESNLQDLRIYNKRNFSISVDRAADLEQAEQMKKIYGLTN